MQPKKHKKTNSSPTGLYELFFVNCAHWRGSTLAIYKTVLIIFPLNLQTITVTLDVVKWRRGGSRIWREHIFVLVYTTITGRSSRTSVNTLKGARAKREYKCFAVRLLMSTLFYRTTNIICVHPVDITLVRSYTESACSITIQLRETLYRIVSLKTRHQIIRVLLSHLKHNYLRVIKHAT